MDLSIQSQVNATVILHFSQFKKFKKKDQKHENIEEPEIYPENHDLDSTDQDAKIII